MHDTAHPPTLTPAHPLFHKVLAIHLQLVVHDQAIQLADARGRLAAAERQLLQAGLEAVERDLRESLQPPEDHSFNWTTLAFQPPAPPAP